MQDLRRAEVVEITMDETGKLWINVDGECALRIGQSEKVVVDIYGQDDVTIERE